MTIRAWDYGTPNLPQTVYKFALKLVDINDNAPKFEQDTYEISIQENNELYDVIFKLNAIDADPTSENSNITYSIKEAVMNDYLSIDSQGNLVSKIRFDREKVDKYVFHVVATDNGNPPLSSTTLVSLNILDINDNYPSILFNTSYYHRFYSNKKQKITDQDNLIESSHSLLLRISDSLQVNADLIDFRASDRDLNSNSKFSLDHASDKSFVVTPEGQLTLAKKLDKNVQSIYELVVICQDLDANSQTLITTLKVIVEVVSSSEFCIKSELEEEFKSRFVNRDLKNLSQEPLFVADYSMTSINTPKSDSTLSFNTEESLYVELLTHKELIQAKTVALDKSGGGLDAYRVQISFREQVMHIWTKSLTLAC